MAEALSRRSGEGTGGILTTLEPAGLRAGSTADTTVPAGVESDRWAAFGREVAGGHWPMPALAGAAVLCSCGQPDARCRTRVLLRKHDLG